MFKNLLMKTMLRRQMKGVPKEDQDRIIALVEKNPDFFTKIAHDVEEKVKGGMSQHDAMMSVMKVHQHELQKMLQG